VANPQSARSNVDPAKAAPSVDAELVPAMFAQALAFHRAGRLDEAVEFYGRILAVADLPAVHSNLGVALASLGRFAEAEAAYRRAIALAPDYAQAHNNLGNALKALDRLDEAAAAFRRAIALQANYPEAYSNLGVALMGLGRLEEAEVAYRHAIALRPDLASAHNNLGNALKEQGRLEEGVAACRQAIALQPDYAEACANLGNIFKDMGRLDEAERALRQALAFRPNHAETLSNLGNVLMDHGRVVDAEQVLRRATVLKPEFAGAHNNLGLALKELGRFEEARQATETAIRLEPRKAAYYCNLSEIKRFAADDPHVAAMKALAVDEASLSETDRIAIHFALAKFYEQTGAKSDAFREMISGNALKRRQVSYDEATTLRQMERIEAVFSPALMQRYDGAGLRARTPIFIVGMLRSGTTLVEQILASHPAVFGAGELKLFDRCVGALGQSTPSGNNFPDNILALPTEWFRDLGELYLTELVALAPRAQRITDKMPSNFLFNGLIHLALPDAVIIHTVRDPVDTCVSCFSRLFSEGQRHTYDLAELGRYYRRYQALMAHWHRVLPAGRILDVRYEDVVADVEGSARRILDHCGLPWDARCLDFHRTERPIRTASATQVRQPIYQTAVGRGGGYAEFLAPLMAELQGDPVGSKAMTP
jgi:tetratricopeptide (TPR) repeat protein